VCPKCSAATRVGIQVNESGVKTRICKKCQSEIA
jgi:ribosomal protein L24